MTVLYFGGQKSGKSFLAERRALYLSRGREDPIYIATYDNSFGDAQMQSKIDEHKARRDDYFVTIEESRAISMPIVAGKVYLIDCINMWIFNTLDWDMEMLLHEINTVVSAGSDIVFVLNDVSSGIIPADKISREYVDRVGIIGQKIVRICDEVFEVKFGLENRLK